MPLEGRASAAAKIEIAADSAIAATVLVFACIAKELARFGCESEFEINCVVHLFPYPAGTRSNLAIDRHEMVMRFC
jgi:hypothetical protein